MEAREEKRRREQEESLKRLEADLKSDGVLDSGRRLVIDSTTAKLDTNPQVSLKNFNEIDDDEDDNDKATTAENDGKIQLRIKTKLYI